MKALRSWAVFAVLALVAAPAAADNPTETTQKSIDLFHEMTSRPSSAIPPEVIANARGIVIIPNVYRVGLVVGGEHGDGLAVQHRESGNWSLPVFVSISGGSLGAEIGATKSDIVMVVNTDNAMNEILAGQFKVGATASATAGPVGSVQGYPHADIYVYKRTKGAWAGINLTGTDVHVNQDANQSFYSEPNVTTTDIVTGKVAMRPPITARLDGQISEYAAKAPARVDPPQK